MALPRGGRAVSCLPLEGGSRIASAQIKAGTDVASVR